jgi:hypothetical protein
MKIVKRILNRWQLRLDTATAAWAGLALVGLLVAQSYVLMEWVFFVTKPSFLDLYSLADKVMVLVLGGALLSSAVLLAVGVLFLLSRLPALKRYPRVFTLLGSLLPAFILAALLLLMIDNFTYTLFSFGISTSSGWVRGLYGLLFVLLFIWSDWQVLGMAGGFQAWLGRGKRRRVVLVGVGAWLALGLSLVVVFHGSSGSRLASVEADGEAAVRQPYIIWITGDGLSDEWLSLYGYERDNTPTLRALADESLVAENAFSNAANTTGSIVSMLTGKDALETRVLFSPDILQGEDSYQHLPGILRDQGYNTIQYGFPFYVDAYVVNMQDGFDMVNELVLEDSPLQARLRTYLPQAMAYFLFEAGNRIGERMGHITFIEPMLNPNQTVLSKVKAVDDDARMQALLEKLSTINEPTFIQIHMLGTHGPRFQPNQQVFSQGKKKGSQADWDMDFYDDAVLEFDSNVGKIVAALEQQGLLENTLLIIGSDHGILYDQRQRIPLLLRFPNTEITGKIQENVQNIDIAPTILDYLGLSQPDWMGGQSLLDGKLEARDIYGARVAYLEENNKNRFRINMEQVKPPFYQVGQVSVVDCSHWFALDLVETTLTRGYVDGHTVPCPAEEVLSTEQAYDLLLGYLRDHGYDVSSLEGLSADSLFVEP